MAEFVIETGSGEEYTIEAADEQAAQKIFTDYSSKNYMGKSDATGVPEGMMFDAATNRMVDARALAERVTPTGSIEGAALKGVPFLGEYADEIVGWATSSSDTEKRPNQSQDIQTQVARESQKLAEENYPKATLAAKIGMGLSTLPLAVEMAPVAIPQGARLGTQALIGAGLGSGIGLTEGFVSGYGEGEGDKRMSSATDRAKTSAIVGGATGALAPFASKIVSSGTKYLMDNATVARTAKKLGYDPKAAKIVTDTMKADDALGPEGVKRLARGGDDAMLVDAGPTSSGLLDAAMQKAGPSARIARQAIDRRVTESAKHLNGTLDLVLGKPPGIHAAANDIAKKSSAARKAAYDAAFAEPIDYAKSSGRQIESVFARTPPSILKAAIDEANDEMISLGLKNQQILASIADDGAITFRQMPNMRQVDELKKALNKIGSQVDDLGRPTPPAVRARRLATDLRNAAVKGSKLYENAVKLGGDKIAEDNALRLGSKLLRPSTTREEVEEAIEDLTDAERKQLQLGVRQYIDDMMANVTRAVSDPNIQGREVTKALKEMSSRAAREKMTLALGDRSQGIFNSLERAQSALDLKAAVATNSKTFARQQVNDGVQQLQEGPYNAMLEGKPLDTGRQLWRKVTGATPEARQQIEQKLLADIAHILTGRRGPEAVATARDLMKAYDAGQLNDQVSRQIGNYLSGALSIPAYQSSSQALSGLGRR